MAALPPGGAAFSCRNWSGAADAWRRSDLRAAAKPSSRGTCPAAPSRGGVKRGRLTKPFWRSDEAIFPGAWNRPETRIRYRPPLIKLRGSTMWDIIISLFYHHACKRYVAAARRQRTLWAW